MVIVHKYGGSSVATTLQIEKIAEHIKELKEQGNSIVVVASAMGKTTNQLISLSHEITKNPNKREMDSLLSTGEIQSVSLLSIALNKLGVDSISLTGFQAGIFTNKNYNHAFIESIDINIINKFLDQNKVVVVAGFQGISDNGDVTTLGRGGSDTTAVAIASALNCECEIYTDVDCIYTINPMVYPNAKKLHQITFDEVMEMAVGGAKVLEARSVELAKKNKIKLYLGRTLINDKSRGTYLMEKTKFENMPITNLSIKDSICMLSIEIKRIRPQKIITKVFNILSSYNMNLEMVSQIKLNKKTILTFSVPESEIENLCNELKATLKISAISIFTEMNLSKLILVGIGFLTHKETVNKIFSVLNENDIDFSHISMSEISVSFTILPSDKEKAINVLAKSFDL